MRDDECPHCGAEVHPILDLHCPECEWYVNADPEKIERLEQSGGTS